MGGPRQPAHPVGAFAAFARSAYPAGLPVPDMPMPASGRGLWPRGWRAGALSQGHAASTTPPAREDGRMATGARARSVFTAKVTELTRRRRRGTPGGPEADLKNSTRFKADRMTRGSIRAPIPPGFPSHNAPFPPPLSGESRKPDLSINASISAGRGGARAGRRVPGGGACRHSAGLLGGDLQARPRYSLPLLHQDRLRSLTGTDPALPRTTRTAPPSTQQARLVAVHCGGHNSQADTAPRPPRPRPAGGPGSLPARCGATLRRRAA